MPDKPLPNKSISPDWLVRGVLTKIGDIFDRLTGRRWKPSSSLATSELVERLKALLDAEAENTEGRGFFVPHNVQLKMQWDKFSADSDESLRKLENELLIAAVDHINDRRYYTYQPFSIEVKPDYFTTGVKLFVSFEKIVDEDDASAINVIVPGNATSEIKALDETAASERYILRFKLAGKPREQTVDLTQDIRKGVGRTKENDIPIDDVSVSKHHASLVLNGEGKLLLADTGSTNGTFVNARRIAYGKAEPLNESDKVNFGTVEVTFQRVPKPAAPPTLEQTQADTVSINGLEFSGKPAEPLEAQAELAPAMEKTIDALPASFDPSGIPLQKTMAPNEVILNAIQEASPKAAEEAKPTQDRIDLDFSKPEEGETEK